MEINLQNKIFRLSSPVTTIQRTMYTQRKRINVFSGCRLVKRQRMKKLAGYLFPASTRSEETLHDPLDDLVRGRRVVLQRAVSL